MQFLAGQPLLLRDMVVCLCGYGRHWAVLGSVLCWPWILETLFGVKEEKNVSLAKAVVLSALLIGVVIVAKSFYMKGGFASNSESDTAAKIEGVADELGLVFAEGWFNLEKAPGSYWCWAKAKATVTLVPQGDFEKAYFEAEIRGATDRKLTLVLNGKEIREVQIFSDSFTLVSVSLPLIAGENRIDFITDQPGKGADGDTRLLGFNTQNYRWQTVPPEPAPYVMKYDAGWYGLERSDSAQWIWSEGTGMAELVNSSAEPNTTFMSYGLRTIDARTVVVSLNGKEVDRVEMQAGQNLERSAQLTLAPGRNSIQFSSAEPPSVVEGDTRKLAFCLYVPTFE